MAIGYVGVNQVNTGLSGNSTAVPMPTGTAAGHLLLVMVGSVASAPALTAPAGWTLVDTYAPGSSLKTALFKRSAVAGDGAATFTWTWGAHGRNFGVAVAYSGASLSAAVGFDHVWTHDQPNAPIPAPSLTLGAGDWLATGAFGRENPGTETAKNWTINDVDDVQRVDVWGTDGTPSIKVTSAWFDSARPLAEGASMRTVAVTPVVQQSHVWSVRIPTAVAPASTDNPWSHMGLPQR